MELGDEYWIDVLKIDFPVGSTFPPFNPTLPPQLPSTTDLGLIIFALFFSIGGLLLYSVVLISAIYRHESAIGVYMSPPS